MPDTWTDLLPDTPPPQDWTAFLPESQPGPAPALAGPTQTPEATIRPQTWWEQFAGGIPRAWLDAAWTGIQGLPALGARFQGAQMQKSAEDAKGAIESLPEPLRKVVEPLARKYEDVGQALSSYAQRQAKADELNQWQLGQAMKDLGPAVTGAGKATAAAPDVLLSAALTGGAGGLAETGARVAGRELADEALAGVAKKAAEEAGLKAAPSGQAFRRAGQFLGKWLTSTRGLTPETFATIESRQSAVAAAKIAAKEESRGLSRLMDMYLKANPDVDQAAFRDSVSALLSGGEPAVKIPESVTKAAHLMRNEVDHLTNTMIDEGMVSPILADTFKENLGSYLTRSYRAFDDPKWIDTLKKTGDWNQLKGELRKIDELSRMPEPELEGLMETIARRDTESFYSGNGIGTIETGIYKRRREIPKAIRDLMGEYKDPAIQYYKTVERMNRNIETHRMYSALRDIGLHEGWLSEKPLVGLSSQLAGAGTSRNPLGGMFTTDEMKALIEGTDRFVNHGVLYRLGGYAKEAKTVGSIQSQMRNFESNLLLLLGGGNLGTKWMPWGARASEDLGLISAFKNFEIGSGKRVASVIEQLDLPTAEASRMGALRSLYQDAAKYGVVGQQVDVNDLHVLLNEVDRHYLPQTGGKLRRGAKATRAAFRRAYEAGDEIPKLAAWQSEMAKYRWALPTLSEDELKTKAAEIVKDTLPTYSRVPKAIERVRQQPFIGNFVSWVSEIPRNVKNQVKLGLSDLRDGASTGNKRLATLGIYRLASLSAALSTPQLVKAGVRTIRKHAPSWSQEYDVAPLLPPWVKQGQYVLSSTDGDTMTVWDLSFMDPFAQLKDAVIASVKTGRIDPAAWDRVGQAFKSFAEPYVNEGVFTGALADIWRGQAQSGRSVYDDSDPLPVKLYNAALYFGSKIEPGTLASLQRIGKGLAGTSNVYGTKYDPNIEALALFGPRIYKINIPQALAYKAKSFAHSKRQAGWNESVAADSTNLIQKTKASYAGAQVRRRSAEQLILAAFAARRAGLEMSKIYGALDKGGLSKADAAEILQGLNAYQSGGPQRFNEWLNGYVSQEERAAAERRTRRNGGM